MGDVMGRIFDPWALLAMLLLAVGGAVVALIVRLVKGDGANSLWRMLETFVLTFLGAFFARTFISILLSVGGDSNGAVVVTSLLFFVWPGVVNLISWPFGGPILGPDILCWIALFVGGLIGLFDGLWATHNWKHLGAPEFLLDTTWGLGGNTNAVLMHLINFAWAGHADDDPSGFGTVQETRTGAHRYERGFAIRGTFAFTQGAVMSNTSGHPPDSELFKHETIHIWQNRLLGPYFWFSYFGWMVILFIPGLIAGLIDSGKRVADAIQWWTYFNNPWEVMAYKIANPESRTGQDFMDGSGPIAAWCCWPWPLAIGLAIPGALLLLAVFLLVFISGYA